MLSKMSSEKRDEVDLVDREDHVLDAEERRDVRVPPRLHEHALARVDEDDGELGVRGARRHVARVLLVPGRVGDDELALLGREEPVGDVDGDALLALGLEPVDQEREVDVAAGRAVLLRVLLERREVILEEQLGVEEQTADERRLAVVDAAAREKSEQRLVLLAGEIFVERRGLGHQK